MTNDFTQEEVFSFERDKKQMFPEQPQSYNSFPILLYCEKTLPTVCRSYTKKAPTFIHLCIHYEKKKQTH